jgi:hypothetical protein
MAPLHKQHVEGGHGVTLQAGCSDLQVPLGSKLADHEMQRLEFAPPPKLSFADTLPWLISSLAVFLFLGSQIISQLQVQTSLVWQLRSSGRQIEVLEREIAGVTETISASTKLLERAEEVAETYNALFTDLLTLAESDADAQAIVAKYQIRNLNSQKLK